MYNFMMNIGEELDAPQQLEGSEVKLILSAIRFGDMAAFDFVLERLFRGDWLESKALVLGRINMPGGSTVLHQAASMMGCALDIVKFICETAPFLMCKLNVQGETAWHIAVRDSSCAVFDILYSQREDLVTNKLMDNGVSSYGKVNINGVFGGLEELSLRAANHITGNTALHEALLYGNRRAAGKLFVADMESCYKVNKENKSPLYMAAELGEIVLFNDMVSYAGTSPGGLEKLARGKSIVHIAILKKLKGSLSLMWDIDPHLFELTDDAEEEEEIALSYLPEVPSELQTRCIGPLIANFDALLVLKNDGTPATDAHAHHMKSNIARLKALQRQTLAAISRGKVLAQKSNIFDIGYTKIDILLFLSTLVVLFSFVLTRISSFDSQLVYWINIIVMYITLLGTSVLCVARISGNLIGLTKEQMACYLIIITSVEGLLITLVIDLLIKKLLYVIAVIVFKVILPIFLLKPFVRATIIEVQVSRSQDYSAKARSKTHLYLKGQTQTQLGICLNTPNTSKGELAPSCVKV